MKTKIKNFLQVLTLHSVSFVIVFAVGFTVLASWNWSTRVSDGDTLTSEKWNAIVAQIEAVEQKASSAEAKAVTAQSTANAKADKSYVDSKVSTASASLSCREGFVWIPVFNKCVQRTANTGGQSYSQANTYCADTYGGRLITQAEYQSACSAGVLSGTGIWEKTGPALTGTLRVSGNSSCSASFSSTNLNSNDGYNFPFRCVY
jgi:hypothetical protein